MEAKRITIRDIAKRCEVHFTTVSRALANHHALPETTRRRIQAVAEEMGYVPDPMLSALTAYRSRIRPQGFQGTLAWLVKNEPPYDWRTYFHEYYEGALDRAKRRGFQIEIFDLQAPGMTPRRMASILGSRNIRGVLVAPLPRPNMELNLPWEQFSAVTFGHTLARPRLHMVGPAQFRGVALTMQQLRLAGYRRIGFIYSATHNERVDHNYLAGYLVEQFLHAGRDSVPPFDDSGDFAAWFARYSPEVVIASSGENFIIQMIRASGLRVPEDVGVVYPFFPSRHQTVAGVYENSKRIGEAAVDAVVAMIQREERGIPDTPQRILIDGLWTPGDTLSPLPPKRATKRVTQKK